jgi:hypothetical protein
MLSYAATAAVRACMHGVCIKMIFSFFLALHFSFSTTDGAGRDAEGQQDF